MDTYKEIKNHCKEKEVKCEKCEFYKDGLFNCKDLNGLTPNQVMYGNDKWGIKERRNW